MKSTQTLTGALAIMIALSQGTAKANPFEARMVSESDIAVIENQLNQIDQMSEADLRLTLELQAVQLESGLQQAIESGEVISEDQKETITEIAQAIREEAAKPKLKKRILLKKMMFLPRLIAQGIGYLGMAATDLIAIPLVFTTMASFNAFAGNQSGVGIGFGIAAGILSGASVGIAELLILGYSFPVVIGAIVPIGLTMSMICENRTPRSEYTKKFCKNRDKNQDFLNRVGELGERVGQAINHLFHPNRRNY